MWGDVSGAQSNRVEKQCQPERHGVQPSDYCFLRKNRPEKLIRPKPELDVLIF
jgi:hypothetical protein